MLLDLLRSGCGWRGDPLRAAEPTEVDGHGHRGVEQDHPQDDWVNTAERTNEPRQAEDGEPQDGQRPEGDEAREDVVVVGTEASLAERPESRRDDDDDQDQEQDAPEPRPAVDELAKSVPSPCEGDVGDGEGEQPSGQDDRLEALHG